MKLPMLLGLVLALSVAGCGSVQIGPTLLVVPTATAVPSVGPSPGGESSGAGAASGSPNPSGSVAPASGSPAVGGSLAILPCKLDTTRGEVCQQSVVGVTTQVTVGSRVFINITLKNTATVESSPISMQVTGPSVAPVLLTAVLGLKGCSDGCTHRTNTTTGTYEAQWPPMPAGATVTFTMNLISVGQSGDVRTVMRLYAETMDELEANALLPTDPAEIGQWQGVDTVLMP